MAINPLFALLQAAGIVPANSASTPQSVGLQDIIVNAAKKPPIAGTPFNAPPPEEEEPPASPSVPAKRRMLSPQQLANREGVGNLPAHKGMFGLKGTLRDILGMVSDAFLVQSGNKPVYAPYREQERTSDAMAEMVSSPIHAVQALLGAGQPEKAYELYKQFQAQGNQDAELDIRREAATSGAATSKASKIDKFRTYAGQALNGANTPEKRAATLAVLAKNAAAINIDPEELGLSDALTPEEQAAFVAGATTVNQQNTLPLARERVKQGQQNADANTLRASRPPQGRAPAKRTATNVDAEILDAIRSGKATPAEKRIYNERLIRSTGAKTAPPPPRRPGDKIKGPNGTIMTSTDGKTWDK